ncbi:hypothetical protein [Flavobacterium sp.]|uniref:hypothetical protein n=1 Tax=Flavobacterium sp. TaxID=239 RepID=UPI0028BD6A20|nr:hypothetical protein [Flavobacterium sp.]
MKSINQKTGILLGIFVVAFVNVALALNSQQSFRNEMISVTQSEDLAVCIKTETVKIHLKEVKKSNTYKGNRTTLEEQSLVVMDPYEKTIEETIAEDNQIIENAIVADAQSVKMSADEAYVFESIVYNAPSTEERIIEDSKIIENPILIRNYGKLEENNN